MSLDLGEKNIGVAISDPMGWTAQGYKVIKCGKSEKDDLKAIGRLAKEMNVATLIVGFPRNMDGTTGPMGEKAINYARRLEKLLGIPVELWDERLSTKAAERMLINGNVRRSKRRKVIDKVAATIILQNYLDSRAAK